MKLTRKLITAIVLGCGLMLGLAACDDDNDDVTTVPVAFVSLYQASPDAPDLDIVVDNRQINYYPFDYADYTGYLRFYTGERTLKFGPYGASNIVADTTLSLEEGNAYSVFVVDEYDDLSVLVLDDNAQAPEEDMALIRLVNLSPDASAVDLVIEGQDDAMFEDQAFKHATDFTEVQADTYSFEVRDADTDEVLLTVPDVTIQPGWYSTIVVRGYETPPTGNPNVLSAEVIVN